MNYGLEFIMLLFSFLSGIKIMNGNKMFIKNTLDVFMILCELMLQTLAFMVFGSVIMLLCDIMKMNFGELYLMIEKPSQSALKVSYFAFLEKIAYVFGVAILIMCCCICAAHVIEFISNFGLACRMQVTKILKLVKQEPTIENNELNVENVIENNELNVEDVKCKWNILLDRIDIIITGDRINRYGTKTNRYTINFTEDNIAKLKTLANTWKDIIADRSLENIHFIGEIGFGLRSVKGKVAVLDNEGVICDFIREDDFEELMNGLNKCDFI
uniref:Uncharacterized protein n=1 Tax=viral metagenome TaxID=1070528 RepID=A0A6C0EBK7_9ZZZZ